MSMKETQTESVARTVVMVLSGLMCIVVGCVSVLLFRYRNHFYIRERGSFGLLLFQNSLCMSCVISLACAVLWVPNNDGVSFLSCSTMVAVQTIACVHVVEIGVVLFLRSLILLFRLRITYKMMTCNALLSRPGHARKTMMRALLMGPDSWFVRKRRWIQTTRLLGSFLTLSLILALLPILCLWMPGLVWQCEVRQHALSVFLLSVMLVNVASTIVFVCLYRKSASDMLEIQSELRNCGVLETLAIGFGLIQNFYFDTEFAMFLLVFCTILLWFFLVAVLPLWRAFNASAALPFLPLRSEKDILSLSLNELFTNSVPPLTRELVASGGQNLLFSLLCDEDGFASFLQFTQSEMCSENVLFWKRVYDFKVKYVRSAEGPSPRVIQDIKQEIRDIIQVFVSPSGVFQINIPAKERTSIFEAWQQVDGEANGSLLLSDPTTSLNSATTTVVANDGSRISTNSITPAEREEHDLMDRRQQLQQHNRVNSVTLLPAKESNIDISIATAAVTNTGATQTLMPVPRQFTSSSPPSPTHQTQNSMDDSIPTPPSLPLVSSPVCVSPSTLLQSLSLAIDKPELPDVLYTLFDMAFRNIMGLIVDDIMPRYLASKTGKDFVNSRVNRPPSTRRSSTISVKRISNTHNGNNSVGRSGAYSIRPIPFSTRKPITVIEMTETPGVFE